MFWPTDLLPASLELKNQHANVLVYGYNADVYSRGTNTPSSNFIHQHAQSLVTSLTSFRKSEGTERLPIIWVVHSLGGIVTKRALLYSNDIRAHQQEDLRSVFVSTYAIIFLGTPHQGSDLATWGRMLQAMSDAIIPRRFFETESVLLKSLKKDNETLQGINNHFLDIYQRFKIHMVHENHTTDLRGTRALVVDANSASPQLQGVIYYGIEATHSGMCKFDGQNAPGYRNVSTAITEWVAVARAVIDIRWEAEEEERKKRAADEYYERGVQAMQSYVCFSSFEGLDQELLTKYHSNARIRRAIATSSFPPSVGSADHPHPVMVMTMIMATADIFLLLIPFLLRPLVLDSRRMAVQGSGHR